MRSMIILAACLGGCAAPSVQPVPPAAAAATAEADVRAAAARFTLAFNALDQARFDALWAEEATAFFPYAPFPIRRVDGRAEVLAWFKRFMDSQRAAGKSPGVDLKDLRVQMAGADGAVVSFHLGNDPKSAARRTLIYRRDADGWRIVHLHASVVTAP